jgi:aminoglycoside 2''-phosphotransferase
VIAGQMGRFLSTLHTTDLTDLDQERFQTVAPTTRARWTELRHRITDRVYPLLLKHQIDWAENLFKNVLDDPQSFEYPQALIHGDLAPYHILFDQGENKIKGVVGLVVNE